ncbi:MAG: NAD(P)-binding domain-containing protein, partial [Candidatus Cloacimonadaceae bacterium]
MRTEFAILGGGAWGLALAKLLSENGHQVRVWEYNQEFVKLLRQTHSNPFLLKDVTLPDNIFFSHDFAEVLTPETGFIIFAIPAQFLRASVKKAAPLIEKLPNLKAVINVAKGIEEHSLKRMSEVLAEELSPALAEKIVCLSGPSHAEEVARRVP